MPKITVSEEYCKGCGLCIDACPRKLVAFDEKGLNTKGCRPAVLKEPEKCTGCAFCAVMCPDVAITVER